jgi:hypothetical protein
MIGAAVLMVVLAGCSFRVEPVLPISDFSFTSSWAVNGQPVACDNRDTDIGYSFLVDDVSAVDYWTETYYGVESKVTKPVVTHRVGQAGVTVTGKQISVENRFRANGGFLPLAVQDALEPNAIIVVPITPSPTSQIGATRLTVTVVLDSGFSRSASKTIPIYGNCPAN